MFNPFKNKFFLFFLNGFLLASIAYFWIEDSYEKQLFGALASYVKKTNTSQNKDSIILKNLHLTYMLAKERNVVFTGNPIQSFKSSLIHPVTFDLMTTSGACGSYTFILSRLLNEFGIQTRIAQMKVNGMPGGHIILEAKTESGWMVLDPSYDLYFTRPDGIPASFNDVKTNWEYYKTSLPVGYNYSYAYEDVRYTNWNKIPVLMPLIEKVLVLFLGKEKTNLLSLRVYFLKKYQILFIVSILFYSLLTILMIRSYRKRNFKTIVIKMPEAFSSNPKLKPELKSFGLVE